MTAGYAQQVMSIRQSVRKISCARVELNVAVVVMGDVRTSSLQADCVQSLDRPSACNSSSEASMSRLADQHHPGDAGNVKNQDQ